MNIKVEYFWPIFFSGNSEKYCSKFPKETKEKEGILKTGCIFRRT